MSMRPTPRVHTVPARFAEYFDSKEPDKVMQLADWVYDRVAREIPETEITKNLIEQGWDPDFSEWLVVFTHAQNRPIKILSEGASGEIKQKSSHQMYNQAMWRYAILYLVVPVVAAAALFIPWEGSLFLFLAGIVVAKYYGFQFFATWAERKGLPSSHGWWIFAPLIGAFVLAITAARPTQFE